MEKKYTYFIILFFFSSLVYSNDKEKRSEYLNILDQEINEIVRLSKSVGRKNPTIFVRMMYVFIQKGKLLKEEENEKFLRISPKKRIDLDKRRFFKKSERNFKKAKKIANFGVRKFKNFPGKGYFFHGLSEVALELGEKKDFHENLKKVFRNSKKGSDIHKKSSITLAEYYYNKKSFSKAIRFYENGLKGKKDRWWTKDAYNLSWCYLLTNNNRKALRLLKQVYYLSKNPNFIDVSYRSERELGYFFVMAGKFSDSIKFYKAGDGNLEDKLVRVSKYLIRKGKHTAAEKLLEYGLSSIDEREKKTNLELQILKLYSKFGKYSKHLKTSKKIYKKAKKDQLDNYQLEIFKNELKLVVGIIQKQVISKRYRKNKRLLKRRLFQTIRYFEYLARLEESDSYKWNFLAGETYFGRKNYKKSLLYYERILLSFKSSQKNKIVKKALEGFLASLKKAKIEKEKKESLTIFGLKNIILFEPKTKRSNLSHQRLFSLYLKKKKINECENIIFNYSKLFRGESKILEEMITKVMSFYKKNGNKKSLYFWAQKIKNKEFRVGPILIKKSNLILLSLKFSKVESDNVKGNKREALAGYLKIYKNSKNDSEVRKNSAFNAAVIFYEGKDLRRSYYWVKKALNLIPRKEVFKFEKTIISIADELFNRRYFKESSDLYFSSLKKVCFTKSKNKSLLLKNSVLIYLSNGSHKKALESLKWGDRCKIDSDTKNFVRLELVKYFNENSKLSDLEKYLDLFSANKKIRPFLIFYYDKLKTYLLRSGRFEKSNRVKSKMLNYYKQSKSLGNKVPLEGLEAISKIVKNNIDKKVSRFNRVFFHFPENKFNKILKYKLKKLDEITSECLNLMSLGSSYGIVNGYNILIKAYDDFINEVLRFTPKGRSKEYISSFRASMKRLVGPLEKRGREFRYEAKEKILKNSILSHENYKLLLSPQDNFINIKYFPLKDGVLMDRGGLN